jgi:NAD(P)H dehydrogenase (quinone)
MNRQIRRVLVHGANGMQGSAIARRLREEGVEVRGSVRNPAKAASLRAAGVEIVAADLESASALRSASEGMDAVVLTLPLDWNQETVLRWTRNAAEAARGSGVGLLVMNSSTRLPEGPTDVPSYELRRATEALVRECGPPSIVLRPPFYMENLAGPWVVPGIVRDQTLAYPIASGLRASWLAMTDLGGYVAAALRRPDLAGRTLDIGGPEVLDGAGLARELGRALGHPLRFFAIAPQAFEQGLVPAFGPVVARGIARSYHWLAQHAETALLIGTDSELERGLSRPLTTLASWARAQAWPGAVA